MLYTGLDFVLELFLGVTEEERKKLQHVEVSFEFRNQKSIRCKFDDNASDYVCYQKIVEQIYHRFNQKEVKLLEYLCVQIHSLIKEQVSQDILINVFVKKKYKNIVHNKEAEAFCRYIEF